MNFYKSLLLVLLSLIFSCGSGAQNTVKKENLVAEQDTSVSCHEFTRENILKRLHGKKEQGSPLVVHLFVPLCDNENQGIIPVSKSLGDGRNLKTNLYWGAGYGIKTHFKRNKSWQMAYSEFNINENILERCVFKKKYSNGAQVILIADAYAGDKMQPCLQNFFGELAGTALDTLYLDNDTLLPSGSADFLIFNGHNGLMDNYMDVIQNVDNIEKDAAVISCLSSSFFMEHLKCLKAYPLVVTRDYLPPEGYIAEAIIDAWAELKPDEEIRLSAGNAMFRIFKRNQKAMQRIFKTGW